MVFVHARNATVKGGMMLLEMAQNRGQTECFLPEDSNSYGLAQKVIKIFKTISCKGSFNNYEQNFDYF